MHYLQSPEKKIGDQYTSSAFIARISPDGMVDSKNVRKTKRVIWFLSIQTQHKILFQIQFDEDLSVDAE